MTVDLPGRTASSSFLNFSCSLRRARVALESAGALVEEEFVFGDILN